ncbi:glycosyltransferase family 2 protein [Chryseobacterium sp. POL2]|uniref:glycosyltransferase family 2 protein n=1 Tax=Chryseobacterium sp. POL2 TaxID=2713414 RepID=UPI0013E11C1D|nr:glycosyltransferase family 2 protein [Chryseobacterium sp. POL2]QIG90339.1 glycosyltransferase family 2 protein [Chryseobacterium sp. POL2]
MKILATIISFNSEKWISKNIQSLYKNSKDCIVDVLVIDNGSTDKTCQIIQQKFPFVNLIRNNENLGFGKANNIAFEYALEKQYNYIFLVNHDGWLMSGFWEKCVPVLTNNKNFGLLSPYHYDSTEKEYDYSFKRYLQTVKMTAETEIREVELINGAFLFISRECLLKTKGFDPLFFFYGEDIDLCLRAKAQGYKIGIIEGANVVHDRKERLMSKERLYYHLIANHLIQFKSIKTGFYSSFCKTIYSAMISMLSKNRITSRKDYIKLVLYMFENRTTLKKSYDSFK